MVRTFEHMQNFIGMYCSVHVIFRFKCALKPDTTLYTTILLITYKLIIVEHITNK